MKYILISTLTFLLFFTNAKAQKKYNQGLVDSLTSWVIIDQIAAKPAAGKYKTMSEKKFRDFQDSVFAAHQTLVIKVFDKYSYPGYDQVGKKGSNNFWLLVQHCDEQPKFQQQVLAAMKKEVDKGNADPVNFAYLTDRVRLNVGQKQLYGTQLAYNTDSCQAIPRLLADSLNVNQRRKSLGMEPVEAYLNQMSQLHFMMNKSNYEKAGISGPKLLKVPEGN